MPNIKRVPYRAGLAVILSIATALFISYSYFKIFPLNLSPNVLTEPWLFREGYLPFNNIADQKPPLLKYLVAAVLPAFNGNAFLAVRILHCSLVLLTVFISLIWVYRIKGGWALISSGVFFLAWSFTFGYWAVLYFDFALTPFYALALLFFTKPIETHRLASSILFGLISGLAVLIKQQAVILCALMALSLIWMGAAHKATLIRLLKLAGGYLIGFSLPIVVFVLLFFRAGGDIGELVYWTVTANLNGSYASLAMVLPDQNTLLAYLPSVILIPIFLWGLFSTSKDKTPSREFGFWLLLVCLSAAILIYPRWSGRHLAAVLPFLAILSGIASAELVRLPVKRGRDVAGLVLYLSVLVWWGSIAIRTYRAYNYQSRLDRYDAYSNFISLAKSIETVIPTDGKVAVIPVDDGTMNLYYILNRLPPGFTFFNYPWFMERRVIQRWLDAMDQDLPTAVIYFKGRLEIEKSAPAMVDYLNQHYRVDKEVTWEGAPVLIMSRAP